MDLNLEREYVNVINATWVHMRANWDYDSKGQASMKIHAKGGREVTPNIPVHIEVGCEITFNKEWTLFFNATNCKVEAISNRQNLQEKLIPLFKEGKWDRNWTKIWIPKTAIIALSSTSDSKLELSDSAAAKKIINIGDLEGSLNLSNHKELHFKYFSEKLYGMRPLMQLSYLKPKNLWIYVIYRDNVELGMQYEGAYKNKSNESEEYILDDF